MPSNGNVVHVIGTGTIGEPLIDLFTGFRKELGIDEVTFSKKEPKLTDRSKVLTLMKRDAKLCVEKEKEKLFTELEMEPTYDYFEAIERASVVIDCTPSGTGLEHKEKIYEKFDGPKGYIAQGSEFGFGTIYAHGINDEIFSERHRFLQIASCNTHAIATLIKALAFKENMPMLRYGRFVCMRRATDLSEETGFSASPKVDKHDCGRFGTHHARDANALFETLGCELNIFSSSIKIPTQYMHAIWFSLELYEGIKQEEMEYRIKSNPLIAVTYKDQTALVFSFGRDHGYYGRIMNTAVVPIETLCVKNGHETTGFAYTPQDGNSLRSSVAATERLLYDGDTEEWKERLKCLTPYLFKEI